MHPRAHPRAGGVLECQSRSGTRSPGYCVRCGGGRSGSAPEDAGQHRWLINSKAGEIVFWTSDCGIDGQHPVDLDDLDPDRSVSIRCRRTSGTAHRAWAGSAHVGSVRTSTPWCGLSAAVPVSSGRRIGDRRRSTLRCRGAWSGPPGGTTVFRRWCVGSAEGRCPASPSPRGGRRRRPCRTTGPSTTTRSRPWCAICRFPIPRSVGLARRSACRRPSGHRFPGNARDRTPSLRVVRVPR